MRNFLVSLSLGLLVSLHCLSFVFAAKSGDDDRLVWAAEDGTVSFAWRLRQRHVGLELNVSVVYPQGLPPAVDAAIADAAKTRFDQYAAQYRDYMQQMLEDSREAGLELARKGKADEGRDEARELFCNTVYSVSRPSAGLVSILYTTEAYGGGAHGDQAMSTTTYNLATAKELTLKDIFPKEKASLAWLAPRIAWDVQQQKNDKPRNLKEFNPKKVTGEELDSVDIQMGRILLTPQGMSVVYPPYIMGSYAEGPFVVEIAKEELLANGANPAIWN